MFQINNFDNSSNAISFNGVKKQEGVNLSRNEVMKNLVGDANDIFVEEIKQYVPENGKFRPVTFECNIPGTQNIFFYKVEYDSKNHQTGRRFSVNVRHQNSDRLLSTYITKGTKAEIMEFLKDKNNHEKIIETMQKLSDSTDDYYNSL